MSIHDKLDFLINNIDSTDLTNINYKTTTTGLDPDKIYIYAGSTCAYGYGNNILNISTDGTMYNEYNYTGKKVTGDYIYHNRIGVLKEATRITFSSTPNAMWLHKIVFEIG